MAAIAVLALTLLWPSTQALAQCAPPAAAGLNPPPGTTVTCATSVNNANGNNGFGTGEQDGLTINVQPGVTVSGDDNGIYVRNGNTINNAGSIIGNAPNGNGVLADDNSTAASNVLLTINNASTGTISGEINGIVATNTAGDATANIINYGTISATGAGGSQAAIAANIVNLTNYGTVSALGSGSDGIDAFFGTATANIANYNLITADTDAINITNGTVVNYSGATISQTGSSGFAVSIVNGDLTNHGTIIGNSSFNAAVSIDTGNVFNSGTITSTADAIQLNSGSIVNTSIISSTGDGFSALNLGAGTVTVTNSGSITANGVFGVGIFLDGTTATITNTGTISANGDTGTGIDVEGTATILNTGTISANGPDGAAVFACACSNLTITNRGLITANGTDGAGILSDPGSTLTAVNIGTIDANGDGAAGIAMGGDGTINNSGTINALGAGGVGIAAEDLSAFPASPNIVNSGIITVTDGTGIRVGDNHYIQNTGTIEGGDGATGIRVANSGQIDNSGTIRVGASGFGVRLNGDDNVLNNSGSIFAGQNGTGVRIAQDNNTFTNTASGVVSVGAGGSGVDVTGGAGHAINNFGLIVAGAGGNGVIFSGDGSSGDGTLTNDGTIRSSVNGYSIFACSCTTINIVNRGTLDGLIMTEGTTGFQNSGLITITDTEANTPIGPFSFNISGGGNGTFEQFAGGTLSVRVNSAGAVDGLLADTVTALAGTLRASIQPGLYANTTIATGAVSLTNAVALNITSTFDRFVSSSPFFTVTPIYVGSGGTATDFNSLDLQLDRIAFNAVPGLSPNQKAVADALEGAYSTTLTGNGATLLGNVLAATSVGVLDQLSGQGAVAAQGAAFGIGSQFNSAMQSQGLFGPGLGGLSMVVPPPQYAESRVARGHEAFASLKTEPDTAQTGRWRVWSAGFGATRSLAGEASQGSSSQSIQGFGGSLGVDRQLTADLLLGFAVGASESMFTVRDLSTSGRIAGGHLGVYAINTWGPYYAAASLSYARFDNSTTRTITGVGPTETASGRFGSDQLSGRIELGWKQAITGYTLTPFVAVEPAVLWQHGYAESSVDATGASGILGLTVASRTATSLPTFVGVQADTRIVTADGAVFAPYARASWVHEFEPDRRISASFISLPQASFTVDGARPAADSARLDAGARLTFPSGPALFASFTGEWSGRTASYAATGGLRAAW